MKFIKIAILFIILTSNYLSAQLNIDAGNDTSYCVYPDPEIVIGGNPTASGGKEPYSYQWTLIHSTYSNYELTIKHILSDTTIANPKVLDYFPTDFNDTVLLELMVIDADKDFNKDTIQIVVSSLPFVTLVYFNPTINIGDSVQIRPINIRNGIPPFIYEWSPIKGLSNPNIKDPFASPDSTTIYYVVVSDVIGCTAWDEVKVSVIKDVASYTDNEITRLKSVVIPNPITESSFIYLRSNLDGMKSISICNSLGQSILIDSFQGKRYFIGDRINKPGIYHYSIQLDKNVVTNGQFIK